MSKNQSSFFFDAVSHPNSRCLTCEFLRLNSIKLEIYTLRKLARVFFKKINYIKFNFLLSILKTFPRKNKIVGRFN